MARAVIAVLSALGLAAGCGPQDSAAPTPAPSPVPAGHPSTAADPEPGSQPEPESPALNPVAARFATATADCRAEAATTLAEAEQFEEAHKQLVDYWKDLAGVFVRIPLPKHALKPDQVQAQVNALAQLLADASEIRATRGIQLAGPEPRRFSAMLAAVSELVEKAAPLGDTCAAEATRLEPLIPEADAFNVVCDTQTREFRRLLATAKPITQRIGKAFSKRGYDMSLMSRGGISSELKRWDDRSRWMAFRSPDLMQRDRVAGWGEENAGAADSVLARVQQLAKEGKVPGVDDAIGELSAINDALKGCEKAVRDAAHALEARVAEALPDEQSVLRRVNPSCWDEDSRARWRAALRKQVETRRAQGLALQAVARELLAAGDPSQVRTALDSATPLFANLYGVLKRLGETLEAAWPDVTPPKGLYEIDGDTHLIQDDRYYVDNQVVHIPPAYAALYLVGERTRPNVVRVRGRFQFTGNTTGKNRLGVAINVELYECDREHSEVRLVASELMREHSALFEAFELSPSVHPGENLIARLRAVAGRR